MIEYLTGFVLLIVSYSDCAFWIADVHKQNHSGLNIRKYLLLLSLVTKHGGSTFIYDNSVDSCDFKSFTHLMDFFNWCERGHCDDDFLVFLLFSFYASVKSFEISSKYLIRCKSLTIDFKLNLLLLWVDVYIRSAKAWFLLNLLRVIISES